MRKITLFLSIYIFCANGAFAATRDAQLTNTTPYNYNYMYPYLNNQMRTNLNPGTTISQSTSPINAIVRTEKMSGERRVVPRTTARNATTATSVAPGRRVVPRRTASSTANRLMIGASPNPGRSGITPTGTSRNVVARSGRLANIAMVRAASNNTFNQTTERASSARCLADYSECMDMYCKREDSAYNRCYCSAKLSQIDAKYQSAIESLVIQIQQLKTENKWSDAEMHEYWMDKVGNLTGTNRWANIDNAININWADFESKVRGQNAFNTGHEYCVQHLQGCYYMIRNLRDAYRSEITRDCKAYEDNLLLIKNAAESIVDSYK